MDLGTVRIKLVHNAYQTAADFIEDMNLVFDNCFVYNGVSHPIAQCARRLKDFF